MKKGVFQSVVVILLAALLLFALSFALRGVAARNAEAVQMHTFRALLPGSSTFEAEPYTGEDTSIRSVFKGETGFVVEVTNAGYADEITLLVGVSSDGSVTGLVVKDMHETWGLGMKALTDWRYLAQYLHTTGDAQIGTDVDALTGATVTSKAITRCVNSAVAVVSGADAESSATSWGG